MKKFGMTLVLAAAVLFSLTGCEVTRQWVIDTAKDVAVKVVDQQIDKFNKNSVVPEIERIEASLGSKVDTNADELWSEDEIASAIQAQLTPALTDTVKVLTSDTDQKMSEKLKDLATKEDGVRGLIALVIFWLLAKLGIKVGPAGFQGLRSYLSTSKPQELPKAPLSL